MDSSHRILAKAVDSESRSDAIVVSFGSEWYESLRHKRFTSVIRKRVPTSIKPRWLYFHINAPKSAVCARAEIRSIENINCARAIQIARELDLSEEEVRNYFGEQELVGCYRLGKISFSNREVTVEEIAAHLIYHPPQSFFVLSKAAKELLDEICSFRKSAIVTQETFRK
jgi:hypothetical protein